MCVRKVPSPLPQEGIITYRNLHVLRIQQKIRRNPIPMLHIRTNVILVEHESARLTVENIVLAAIATERRHNSHGNRIQMCPQLRTKRSDGTYFVGRNNLEVFLPTMRLSYGLCSTHQLAQLVGRIGEEHVIEIRELIHRSVHHSVGAFKVQLYMETDVEYRSL